MIGKDIGIGQILITDSHFGHVIAGNEEMPERLQKAGLDVEHITAMVQVHDRNIEYAQEEGLHLFEGTDGLWTDKAGIAIYTKTADCVPILLWSEQERVVAALHCGWKGFLAGIIEAFAELCEEKGFEVSSFQAFLGPHLRAEHFEVQEDFLQGLPERKGHLIENRDGKHFFHITDGVLETLENVGVKAVEDCGIDTYNNLDFFSYRTWNQTPESERTEHYFTFANCIVMNPF